MPWSLVVTTMPFITPALSSHFHRVLEIALTLLITLVHAKHQETSAPTRTTRAQTRPRRPGRARASVDTPRARQRIHSPRQLRPRLAISARRQLRHDTRRRQDMPVGPREHCGHRHRRRDPPRHCPLPPSSRSHPSLVFTTITRISLARTPAIIRAHALPLRRPGTPTPSTTLAPPHGHLPLL